ncbi:MAG: hypothetical protein ABI351_02310 [Herbaspirillum sp.]
MREQNLAFKQRLRESRIRTTRRNKMTTWLLLLTAAIALIVWTQFNQKRVQ